MENTSRPELGNSKKPAVENSGWWDACNALQGTNNKTIRIKWMIFLMKIVLF